MKYIPIDLDRERWHRRAVLALDFVILFSSVAILWIGIISSQMLLSDNRTVVYNCTWVEITPDVPIKVREECRRKQVEQFKKENK